MYRREYCTVLGSCAGVMGFQSRPTQSQVIEVGLYVTERALSQVNREDISELQRVLEAWFESSFPSIDVCIEIGGVIETPLRTCESTVSALSWWRDASPVARNYSDCKLLLFAESETEWSEFDGRAVIGGRNAVASGIDEIDTINNKRLAFHEVLHCFGLRHDDAGLIYGDTHSIMHPHMDSNAQVLSSHSRRVLRGNL